MQLGFTKKAQMAIEKAKDAAIDLRHPYIGTEHLLLGLSLVTDSVSNRALFNQDIDAQAIEKSIKGSDSDYAVNNSVDYQLSLTPRTKKVLDNSVEEALRMGTGYIGTEHILLALLREQDCIAVQILNSLGANVQQIYNDILDMLGESGFHSENGVPMGKKSVNGMKTSSTPTLDKFSRDFTKLAQEHKFDPIIGRDKEIERVIQILSRRTKNNPCLIGDPGVGKTAVAEGLAQKIIEDNVPEILKNKRVVSLDLSSMVAGSKYRGEFEDRIKKVIEELNKYPNIILFIDELHTIIGAGSAEGSLDASNILKPSLARGEIQVIGATTLDEYRKYIEKDSALERRFQPVKINEPTEDESVAILKGLRDRYEAHHNVTITDAAIAAAVTFSSRYITDRFLPDKAIDLVDEAASKVRLKSYTAPEDIKILQKELDKLSKEKEAAIKVEEFELASEIKEKESKLKERLELEKNNWLNSNIKARHVVDVEEIADVVAVWTGIPIKKLKQEEEEKLKNMECYLHSKIVGQEEAVNSVSRAVRRGRVGLKDPKRPLGSFLFLGPTGVGKTELCKSLAEILFDSEDQIIRIDMSEYMEKHSVSRLVGSPPGYVGFDEGGQLTDKVRIKPYSLILFDEIEKAHPDVFNMLLQILDDGHLTDSQGRKVNFKNTVIIMTSNAGAKNIISPKKLGFVSDFNQGREYEDMKRSVMDEVKNIFKPEFLNRIDDIVVFHSLNKGDVGKIARLMISEVIKRVKDNLNIELDVQDSALDYLVDKGFNVDFGARALRRTIQTNVEDKLAELILAKEYKSGDRIVVRFEDGKLIFNKDE